MHIPGALPYYSHILAPHTLNCQATLVSKQFIRRFCRELGALTRLPSSPASFRIFAPPSPTGQPRNDVAIRRPDAQRSQRSLESPISTMYPIDVDSATRATTSGAEPLPSPDPPAIGAAEDQMEDG